MRRMHVQDMVEKKEAIKMKGINREIKIYAVEGRKEVFKAKNEKADKERTNKGI